MSRTPLFQALRRACMMARIANRPGAPPANELPGLYREWRVSRRQLLKAGGVLTAAAGIASLPGCGGLLGGGKKSAIAVRDTSLISAPRVVIVGAGLAGLNAAYTLRKNGILAQVFEASPRVGGRVYSRTGLLAPDLTTELGGEFIDSNHIDILSLADEFKLPLLDMEAGGETDFATMYYVDGQAYSTAEIIEAFRPIASLLDLDKGLLPEVISNESTGEEKRIDRLSVSAYLKKLGVTGWLKKLLETAYVTEFGLEADEQSALNLVTMIGTRTDGPKFEVFGESDERYKVDGGNDRIAQALSGALTGQVSTNQTLESIRSKDDGYSLVFRTQNGTAKMVAADVVIIAIPFTKLRQAEILVDLPPLKRRAIAELGYGANAKVFLGFVDRPWRTDGYSGSVYTDQSYQLAWDNSRRQNSSSGGLTCYSGGKNAIAVGKGDVGPIAAKYLGELGYVFPGVEKSFNGKSDRFHWPTQPFTLASYAAYRVGQWTSIRGAEGTPVNNLYFAGEHCSMDFQGFMNGAAETGRVAAEAILERVRR